MEVSSESLFQGQTNFVLGFSEKRDTSESFWCKALVRRKEKNCGSLYRSYCFDDLGLAERSDGISEPRTVELLSGKAWRVQEEGRRKKNLSVSTLLQKRVSWVKEGKVKVQGDSE